VAEELRAGCVGPPLAIALAASAAPGPIVVWEGHDSTVLACARGGRRWSSPAPLSPPGAGARGAVTVAH